ncbi:MAG: YVTN family beta-propeller repeat-containing protein [Rikenellaceae bacterium]
MFPTDIAVADGKVLITSRSGNGLLVFENGKKIAQIEFNAPATSITVGGDAIYVTTSYDKGFLHKLSRKDLSVLKSIETGMGARAVELSDDGKFIYVCNQFKGDVVKIDASTMEIVGRVDVLREPFAMALSKDGNLLYVNNFLPHQPANLDIVAADVSVVDTRTMTRTSDVKLSNGSNALRDIAVTNDGRFVLVSHNLGRFQVPTSQLQQGWMNTNAMSVIDAKTNTLLGSVLLDSPERGAAGVWGIKTTADKIFVSHSGSHEITAIDYHAFVEKLDGYAEKENLSIDLRFLYGISQRIKVEGNGPRAMCINGDTLYAPTYFSDHLNMLNIKDYAISAVELNPSRIESAEQQGERIFNDASYCFQQWQSCNGCHPGDARTDGMNWDLLNDGVGNPKNCKSMLNAHKTAPNMISGIRADAESAVRAGFKYIQFTDISEEDAVKVDEYLKTLKPLPSPALVDGKLSPLAERGRQVFESEKCDACHSGPLFTDMKMYRIGDDVEFENGWDTPSLVEVWRTAPYLFDGRAATLEDLFSVHKHGINTKISKKDMTALVEYVKSL